MQQCWSLLAAFNYVQQHSYETTKHDLIVATQVQKMLDAKLNAKNNYGLLFVRMVHS